MTYPHPEQEEHSYWEEYVEGGRDFGNAYERTIQAYRYELPEDNDEMFTVRVLTSDKELAHTLHLIIGQAIRNHTELHAHCNRIVEQRLASEPPPEEPAGRQVNGKNASPDAYDGAV